MNERVSISISPVFRAIALVAVAGLASFACRPSQTVERQTKDAALEAQVKAKLAAEVGAASVTAIEVNVTNGVVTLAGPVSTEDERQRAEAAARSVDGVTSVNNNLQVTTTGVAGSPDYGTPPLMAMTPEMAMPPPTPASGTTPVFVPFPTPTASP